MRNSLFYSTCISSACQSAVQHLRRSGVSFTDHPSPTVTHVLLDIPSFRCQTQLAKVLPSLPDDIILIGGKIPSEVSCTKIDLLEDPFYLWENAAITAECALRVAFQNRSHTLRNARVLIIGWGRIGKQLARLLSALGAKVSIYSSTHAHQAEASVFGFPCLTEHTAAEHLSKFQIIFNTAPAVVIPQELPDDLLKIELASKPGLRGKNVIPANGLPGRLAPEASGELIARTILRICKEAAV